MRFSSELLYSIFEKALFVPHKSHQDIPEFVDEVVAEFLRELASHGMTVPPKMRKILASDLREEVIEMTRKKIYGYSSISEYRVLNSEMIEQYYKENA